MKKLLVSLFFCCTLATPLLALSPPKPVEGTPMILSKSFTSKSGDYVFTFKFPSGWGMGEMKTSPDGSGNFVLYPEKGGHGCRMEMIPFESEKLAKEALENLKISFKETKDLKGGFEVDLSKAWFAAKVEGKQLIQIWYSLPKKTKESGAIWESLKNCVSLSQESKAPKKEPSESKPKKYEPVTEDFMRRGWVCHHPSNKLHVIFEAKPLIKCALAKDNAKYQLSYDDTLTASSGFFYVKWDPNDLQDKGTFQQHLKDMLQDIRTREPNQKMADNLTCNLEGGYAQWSGNPYDLWTVAGDGFLFGFAVKPHWAFKGYDINDLVKKVKWYKD